MAIGRALSVSLLGIQAELVEVEVDVATGLPAFTLTALSDRVLTQLANRLRSAVSNSGESWPNRKVTVALSPATVPRTGSGFDVPVACALLAAAEALPAGRLRDLVLLGELGLDGTVRPVTARLPRPRRPGAPRPGGPARRHRRRTSRSAPRGRPAGQSARGQAGAGGRR